MNKEKIYGVFEHEGKEYPFALENQILTIPQIPFLKNYRIGGEIVVAIEAGPDIRA